MYLDEPRGYSRTPSPRPASGREAQGLGGLPDNPTLGFNDIRQYIRSFRTIKLGATTGDKLSLLQNRLRVLAYPLNRLSLAQFGRPFIGETNAVYRCVCDGLTFFCSGGRCEEQLLDSYEPQIREELFRCPNGDFVDVGANIGVYSIRMAHRLGLSNRVVAIEPHPLYQSLLERTMAANGLTNMKVVKAAAWSAPCTLTLYEHILGGPRMDNSVVYSSGGSGIAVPATTLDAVVESENLDRLRLVKIDAEGAEVEIIKGMRRTLDALPSLRIVFEALTPENLQACQEVLSASGFHVRRIVEGVYLGIR